jgi:DNA-binding transcriptional regulator YdaS (Cro superfamily)
MRLEDYLFKKRLTKTEFARKIGYGPQQFSKAINGHVKLTVMLVRAIEQFTDGMVSYEDLLESIEEKNVQKKMDDDKKP